MPRDVAGGAVVRARELRELRLLTQREAEAWLALPSHIRHEVQTYERTDDETGERIRNPDGTPKRDFPPDVLRGIHALVRAYEERGHELRDDR